MNDLKDIEWFKKDIASFFEGFELTYRFFSKGDFGSLNQVDFNSEKIGGNVDFWGLGWFGIFVRGYEKNTNLLNVLSEPNEEKEELFEKLLEIIKLK